LFSKTHAKIIGVDISAEALKIAKTILSAKNVEFIRADINKLPFRDSLFDLIISLGVIEHLHNPKTAVREMEQVLKKDGVLFITVPNAYCFPHRILRFLRRKLKTWQFGIEESFTVFQLKAFLSQSSHLESGYFYWGRKPLFKIFKKVFGRIFLKFGSMVYIVARKES